MQGKENNKATRPMTTTSVSTEKRIRKSTEVTMESSRELQTDRISQLPDEILDSILRLLTMKEAATTSVLSKRWRYLWTLHPCLNFDSPKVLHRLEFETEDANLASSLSEEKTIYVNWVNQVVTSHRGTTIDQLMVHFILDQRYSKDIDVWVDFALKKNVHTLSLDFKCETRYIYPDQRYNFTPGRSLVCSSGNLTSLRLTQVNVTGEVLGYVLSSCPLESLVVHHSICLTNLEVSGALHKLKSLEIVQCYKMERVVVTAPNLVSFTYHGPRITMQLNDASKLVNMSLGNGCCDYFTATPSEFSSYRSQLEVLILHTTYIKADTISAEFPPFPNLRQLEVDVYTEISLLCYTSLIKACPLLHKFSMKLYSCKAGPTGVQSDIVFCPHYNLKVVEVGGFVGRVWDVELVSYLMKNAVMLEEMIFDTRHPVDIGTPWEFQDTEKKQAARIVAKQLLTKLGPGVTSSII